MNERVRLACVGLFVVVSSCAGEALDVANDAAGEHRQAVVQPTTAVGVTVGHGGVSPTGAFTFSVPLWTPPGVGQVQPQLSLEYASDRGNSPFGVGWSLSGQSAIRRCPRTVASNGTAGPVELTDADRYCLNGTQLKLVSGAHGQLGAVYATEVETFARIEVSAVTAGGGAQRFRVMKKSGRIETYEPASPGTTGPFHTWHLTRVEDRDGNRAEYEYVRGLGGAAMLSAIRYPMTALSAVPLYRVSFRSEPRPDEVARTTAGQSDSFGERITRIEVSNAVGALIKAWELTYAQGPASGRSVITAIQECSPSGCLEPLTVTTEATNAVGFSPGWETLPVPSLNPFTGSLARCGGIIPVDLSGDGRTDLLYARQIAATSSTGALLCRWYLRLAIGGRLEPTERALPWLTNGTAPGFFVGNFLLTARNQVLLPIPNQTTGANPVMHAVDFDPATGTFTAHSTGIPQLNSTSDPRPLVHATDLDGDGRPELIFAQIFAGGRISARLNTTVPGGPPTFGPETTLYTLPAGFRTAYDYAARGVGLIRNVGSIVEGDFNGDGLRDLGVSIHGPDNTGFGSGLYNNINSPVTIGFLPLLSKGSLGGVLSPLQAFSAAVLQTSTDAQIDAQSYATVLDVNGDGCSDFEMGKTVSLSNCMNGWKSTWTSPTEVVLGAAMAVDLNQDDRADLLHSGRSYLQSLGTSFAPSSQLKVPAFPAGCGNPFLLDWDGDGRSELGVACGTSFAFTLQQGARADVITEVKNAFGAFWRPRYFTIASGGIYTAGSEPTWPYRELRIPFPVVGELLVSEGDGTGRFLQTFTYGSAVTHLAGRGFQGFRSRSVLDDRQPSVRRFETFSVSFPSTGMRTGSFGAAEERAVLGARVGDDVSAVVTAQVLGAGFETRYFPYVESETTDAWEARQAGSLLTGSALLSTTVKTTVPDAFGNLVRVTTTVTDRAPSSRFLGQQWATVEQTAFVNDTGAWCLGVPESGSLSSSAPSQPTLTRSFSNVVDRAKCRVSSATSEPLEPTLKTTRTFEFDACGNVRSVTVIGSSPDGSAMAPRVTTASFGGRCQFPEWQANAEGETWTARFDPRFGVLTERVDPNRAKTSWAVDDFGRVVGETRPDGTSTVFTFQQCTATSTGCWDEGTVIRGFAVETRGLASDGALVTRQTEVFDGAGRVRRSESLHPNGQFLVDARYSRDGFGRVATASSPGAETWLDRDLHGRVVRGWSIDAETLQTVREWRFEYDGHRTRSIDPRGHVRTEERDARGLLRGVTEPAPGGSSSFEYDALGRLTRSVGPTGATSTSVFDLLGHATSIGSADTGPLSFRVNSLGEVLTRTNARGQVSVMQYDRLGRLRSLVEPEGQGQATSAWVYGTDPLARNRGRLVSQSRGASIETLTWDVAGRPSSRTVAWGTPDVQRFDYAYNSQGALDTVTYPLMTRVSPALNERIVFKYGYDAGRLTRLWDSTRATPVLLWSLDSLNPHDQPLQETFSSLQRTTLAGDLNRDGVVNSLDLALVRSLFGTTDPRGDTNGDGFVNSLDLARVQAEFGQQATLGNAITSTPVTLRNIYHPVTHSLATRQATLGATRRLDQTFAWDPAGNLLSRRDELRNLTETFVHDPLNRLTSATVNGANTLGLSYDPAGNLTWKSDVGPYAYADPTRRHAVTSAGPNLFTYDADGNVSTKNGDVQTWTAFNTPLVLRRGSASSTFEYGPGRDVYLQTSTFPASETIRRAGEFERVDADGRTTWRVRFVTSSGAQLVRDDTGAVTVLVADHLGSPVTLLSPTTGTLLAEQSYAPFGARRAASDWWSAGLPTPWALHERTGFGAHDQLDNVGFVHMGGRAYDPAVGRFLSVDPVRHLERPQTLNRYSYIENRAVSGTDPTGFEGVFSPPWLDPEGATPSIPGVVDIRTSSWMEGDTQVISVTGRIDRSTSHTTDILWRWASDTASAGPGELSRSMLGDGLGVDFGRTPWGGPVVSAAPALRRDTTLANLALGATGLPGFMMYLNSVVEDAREYGPASVMAGGTLGVVHKTGISMTLYRGVSRLDRNKTLSRQFVFARQGVAVPRGGNASASAHSYENNTNSKWTSWSESEHVARTYAGADGIVLSQDYDVTTLLMSNAYRFEREWLVTGMVPGCRWYCMNPKLLSEANLSLWGHP